MNEALCKEKHKQIEERLNLHEKRLNKHSDQLDHLSEDSREYKIQIQNLCEQVKDLITTMKWFMGLFATSLLGFFFYAVQQLLLR
ncbi:hemolysin XhlA family protein [Geosporobacter ferrireducens]|uniref:Hemolysin XhlA n=1 Tax=Geosporobacter ferrireducens TaxID=1424294 RepID=A0A1D8GIF2_9FIRM|nr:hemolysin XhlA family protein [Geosporobacter ferrireducens]AOT70696.1 hypothetical protein Gferi_14605 [Geosporobacter ferrireducens]MTI57497.1 hypothetical protein [Geosporobacter ferrireducens]